MPTKTSRKPTKPLFLLCGILLIAANLRAPITGVAPLLDLIREAFGFGTAEAGALTTLPLLIFAIMSPFCVLLAREYGLERSLFVALLLTACGVVLRSVGPAWALFLGTAVIGIGIAIANVLLPSLVKRDFPRRIATLTSAYVLTAGIVAALASALAIPVARLPDSGWNWALGAFLVFPIVGLAAWAPQLSRHSVPSAETATPPHGGPVWHSLLAWQVTLFFGLNSLIYYVTVTWLPTILADAGFSPTVAGSLHGASQLATAVPGLFLGPLVGRLRDQGALAVAMAAIMAAAFLGLLLLPRWAPLWTVMFGFGSGATFILGLAFISLRTANMRQAAVLSGMAQSVGYLVAAAAPPAVGMLHDLSGGWSVPLVLCMAVSGAVMAFGHRAGRATHIA